MSYDAAKDSEVSPEEVREFLQNDDNPTLEAMLRDGCPLTRSFYLGLAGLDDSHKWTAEHEMMMPEPFQDWSQVIDEDGDDHSVNPLTDDAA